MLDIRPGLLYAIPELIRLVERNRTSKEELCASFPRISEVPTHLVLDLACSVGWIEVVTGGSLYVMRRGAQIRAIPRAETALLAQLEDIVRVSQPAWAATLTQGRAEFVRTGPPDVVQCFRDAGLLSGSSQETVALLDSIAEIMRAARSDERLSTGRLGERLTIEYEAYRTGVTPQWTALDTARAGYDVLSIEGRDSVAPLPIEVKATVSNFEEGQLYLTRHEYDIASVTPSYTFHCWLVGSTPRLFVVRSGDLINHAPLDQQRGTWQKVRIPYDCLVAHEVAVPRKVTESLSAPPRHLGVS